MNALIRPTDAELTPPPHALTAQGGQYEVAPELREMLCYLDTGELLVVQGCTMDPYVLAFRDDLRRQGLTPPVRCCSLAEVREHYARSPTAHNRVAGVTDSRRESATVHKVMEIITGAVRENTSDVHFFDDEDLCRIRIRVNGLLEDFAPLPAVPAHIGLEMRAAIYQGMCDVADSTFKPHQPQDARLKESIVRSIGLYGARVATRPLDKGQMMVCRLLYRKTGEQWTLERLGYLPEQAALISAMTENKHGIHIFSGATGSGKSTSLEVLITRLIRHFKHQLHVLTLENPPEYKIAGARQTPVIGDDWSGGIKNAMRLDPDVIMIGEMRDFTSAQSAFQAALTGHGVWTTLHANDPFAILQRLDDLKLDPGLYSDASLVRGLIYQALVPILCDKCRIPFREQSGRLPSPIADRVRRYCDAGASVYLHNEQGCTDPRCRKGLKGRSVVAEVVSPTQDLLDAFRTKGKAAARAEWLTNQHGITRAAHVTKLIREGLVDPVHGESMVCRLDYDDILLSTHA